jgi:hypothetical protein
VRAWAAQFVVCSRHIPFVPFALSSPKPKAEGVSKGASIRRFANAQHLLSANGFLAVALFFTFSPATAQTTITSSEPEAVSLTIYRDPDRGDRPIDANWPTGYALVTETRTITIPAGDSIVRFEGVAEGMFPESAIVTGLPKGVREKNRDARLLSPSGLVDAYLKRQVMLTRTDRATGTVRQQQAMITAGPDGGVILQTGDGYEALRCTGLPERMGYDGVPAGLSAKPTLSVITSSDKAITAKVTLTYMAAGFDWQANYVTQVSPDKAGGTGKSKVDVFAWMTLANGGNQSFLNANTMAIAGKPNREANAQPPRATGEGLTLRCWPAGRTHEVPFRPQQQYPWGQPAPGAVDDRNYAEGEAIVVTAYKRSVSLQDTPLAVTAITVAELEDLGDLKLYRIPEPVTVNAKGQKQVAMIVKPGAKFDRLYRGEVQDYDNAEGEQIWPMDIVLRTENKSDKGLGLPLPSGQAMIFEDSPFGPLLAGEAALSDRAIGDKVELAVGLSTDVRIKVTQISDRRYQKGYRVTLSNARDEAVNAEVKIPFQLRGKPKHLAMVDGVPTWRGAVPANGETAFTYTLKLSPEE